MLHRRVRNLGLNANTIVLATVLTAVGATGAFAATLTPSHTGHGDTPAHPATSYVWIYPKAALKDAKTYDPGLYNELATGKGQKVYELMNPTLSGTNCDFTDNQPPIMATNFVATEHEFSGDITSLTVPSGTGAMLLDQESWGCTSSADHADPYDNDQHLASLAQPQKLTFTTAPGLDLFKCGSTQSSCLQCPADASNDIACQPCTQGTSNWQCYVDYDMAGLEALNAKVIDVQSQSLEGNSATWDTFVSQAISEAEAANPKVTVLVGLTDNTQDCGSNCTANYLKGDLNAALKDGARGAWINEPDGNYTMMDRVVCGVLKITCS